MEDTETTLSIRDTITNAVSEIVPDVEVKPDVKPEPVKEETEAQKAERLRDETGKFVKSDKVDKEVPKVANPALAVDKVETKPRPQRPSSWKKEMWDHWEKLDPTVAEYVNQREQEFSKGVSTYKNEWERAKPIVDAMAPFVPVLQQHGVDPASWVKNLGSAHQMLVFGSPEDKLSMFLKMAKEYQVPLQNLFVEGQDGKVYLNPSVRPFQAQQAQQQPDVRMLVEDMFQEREANRMVAELSGSKEYPHFNQLRETMAGLLQANLAPDLKTAYDAALRMPQHSDIWDSIQKQKDQEDAQKRADEAARQVSSARSKAISPKTSTPGGPSTGAQNTDIRSTIEAAAAKVLGGRV